MPHRIRVYLWEMYPPMQRLIFAFLYFFSLYFSVQGFYPLDSLKVDMPAVVGALTFYLFLFFLRVSDEIKDLDIDSRLFPDRAVPSGAIRVSDLYVLFGLTIGALVALNATMGNAPVAFAALMVFGLVMFKWFFLRDVISKNLLLALVTHNPSVLFINFYCVAIFAETFETVVFAPWHIFAVVVFWLPGLIWELCRKVRAPADETEYVTYSRIFGHKVAAILPAALMIAHCVLIFLLGREIGLSPVFLGVQTLSAVWVVSRFVAFVRTPSQQAAAFKPHVERHILVLYIGFILDLCISRGVMWQIP